MGPTSRKLISYQNQFNSDCRSTITGHMVMSGSNGGWGRGLLLPSRALALAGPAFKLPHAVIFCAFPKAPFLSSCFFLDHSCMLGDCTYSRNCAAMSVHENCSLGDTQLVFWYAAYKAIRDRLQAPCMCFSSLMK